MCSCYVIIVLKYRKAQYIKLHENGVGNMILWLQTIYGHHWLVHVTGTPNTLLSHFLQVGWLQAGFSQWWRVAREYKRRCLIAGTPCQASLCEITSRRPGCGTFLLRSELCIVQLIYMSTDKFSSKNVVLTVSHQLHMYFYGLYQIHT